MNNITTVTAPIANRDVVSICRNAVDEFNRDDRKACATDNATKPTGRDLVEPYDLTVAEVMRELVAPESPTYITDVVHDILESILQAVESTYEIDPWPELTRKKLFFLVGGRKMDVERWPIAHMLHQYSSRIEQPLALREKMIAFRHRYWLNEDADKKSMKLAEAKATVAALEGPAV